MSRGARGRSEVSLVDSRGRSGSREGEEDSQFKGGARRVARFKGEESDSRSAKTAATDRTREAAA